jgi:hypothetical protein
MFPHWLPLLPPLPLLPSIAAVLLSKSMMYFYVLSLWDVMLT